MKIKGLKFEAQGSSIFVANKNDHNLFVMRVEPGCQCPPCRQLQKNAVQQGSDASDTAVIAQQIVDILNQ